MMASPLRVSVCIVTYNQARYIEDTVLGALGQSGDFRLEVLVGNDRSSDDTAAILDRLRQHHPDRIVVLNRPANLGPGGNLEDLMRRATGDFIAHLDGDDAWLPGKLRAQLEFLSAHPECPAVYTNGLVVDAAGRLRGAFTDSHPPLMPLAYLCARGNFLMHSAMMYRRECLPDLLAPGSSLIDYRQHLTLARRGPLGFIDAPLAVYRLATTTSLAHGSTDWLQRQIWAALQEATAGLPEAQRRGALAHFMARVLLSCVSGDRSKSWALLREAARNSGYSCTSLLRAVLPAACAIAAHGIIRRLLVRVRAGARLAEYYRV